MPAPYLSLGAVILGVALLQLANGALMTFLPVRLTFGAFSSTEIGLIATGHAVGFLVGCLSVNRLIRSIGHIRAFAVFAASMAAVALAFAVWVNPLYWLVLRLVTGFCSAGLFTVAESWLAAQTPGAQRGRVISIYMIFNKMAFAGGQLVLTVGDVGGMAFYMIGAAFYALSLIPMALSTSGSPPVPGTIRLRLRRLYRIAPAGVVGCFVSGLVNSAVVGVAPLYGAQIGLPTPTIAVLMAVMQIGSLILQWPLGWASDRTDRRRVVIVATLGAAAASLALGFAGAGWGWWLHLLFGLWGGFALSIYSICIAHAQDRAPPGRTVQLSAGLLLCWAAGSAVGPTVATLLMDQFGPGALFFYSGVVSAALAAFIGWRMSRRRPRPLAARDRFVNLPATSPAAMALDPRRPDDEDAAGPATPDAPRSDAGSSPEGSVLPDGDHSRDR